MNKRLLNLALFSSVLVFIISLPIIFTDQFLPRRNSPWQLQPFNADSLSSFYKGNYRIIGDTALITYLKNTSRAVVNVLVDGWGVPYDKDMLVQDFGLFKDNSPTLAVHNRMFGYTAIIENSELQNGFADGVFLFNGDSAGCKKKQQNLANYFSQIICLKNHKDIEVISTLDSLLAADSLKRMAWTTYETREGDREKLHQVLNGLSNLAKKYPQVQFIIQGTHRPILGASETRRKYLAPWVPAVFVNGSIKAAN